MSFTFGGVCSGSGCGRDAADDGSCLCLTSSAASISSLLAGFRTCFEVCSSVISADFRFPSL